MADEGSVVVDQEKDILENLNSFLSGCGDNKPPMRSIDRIQCGIILLQSLPCARYAVLEQLCGAFHESMNKFMIEMERKAQLGGSGFVPEVVDADLDNALHSICDVVSEFVTTNPSSWALLICEWCLNLLGDLISKFDQKRGVSLTLSFNEGFHKWMSFPPVQMLMGIGTLCCSRLVVMDPDNCIEALLQISIKYSPHLDWVVAHIVSHFHEIIIKKLLNTALRDYANNLGDESEEKSLLVSTIVQVLGYLSVQFASDIKTNLLALFHASLLQEIVGDKEKREQIATIPFLLHIASLSPELLKGTLNDFVEVLSPSVLVQIYDQSVLRSTIYHKQSSLIPALVDIITNIEIGAYSIFCFLLNSCSPIEDKAEMEIVAGYPEVKKACSYIMEGLLIKLQDVVSQRYKLFTQKAAIAPLVPTSTESAFLLEMSSHTVKLTKLLLEAKGKRLGWIFRLLVLVSVHSGETTAIQILTFILTQSKTNESLNLFVQMQCDIEFYFHCILQETIKKCMMSVNHSNATAKPSKVKSILDNIHQLIIAENSGLFPAPRYQIVDILQEHIANLLPLISHSNHSIASKTLTVLLSYDQAIFRTVSLKNSVCRNVSAFLFQQLRELVEKRAHASDIMERIKLCTHMLSRLSKDEDCRLLLIRIFVESTLQKENYQMFGAKLQGKDKSNILQSSHAPLLEYNQNPHISSRLALSPSSLFFTGVIGNKNRNGIPKKQDDNLSQDWLPSCQVYMDTLVTLCRNDSSPEDSHIVTSNTDYVALLLMELVCPDMVLYNGEWPDEETLKFNVERDLRIRNTFDKNPVLWWLLLLVSQGVTSLCKCAPLISSLLSTVMSSWEVCRDKMVTRSSELFRDTQYIMHIMVKGDWLPTPLSRIGGVLHLISPKEIFAVINTMWKVLKECPPQVNRQNVELRWKQGSVVVQKEVIKAIFINNISTLGQHYARVFQNSIL